MLDVESIREEAEKAWEQAKRYLRMGGDPTYAHLKLALRDLELVEPLIRDRYCRRQVRAEIDLLRHALNLAMVAFEWRLGPADWKSKLKLWVKAVKESLIILLLQLKRI